MEENVPVRIPTIKTKEKSVIIPAPKIYKETAASKVVILVKIERANTLSVSYTHLTLPTIALV